MLGTEIAYAGLVNQIAEDCQSIFMEKCAGVYLHGSLAMGCFHPRKSDLDLLVIVNGAISAQEKDRFMKMIVRANEKAPAKGLEVSIVQERFCRQFVYPTPFELHFSAAHLNWYQNDPAGYIQNMRGTDPDLAAHFVIIRQRGIAVCGKAIAEVFGEVPAECYFDSIRSDVANAENEIAKNPMYMILNLCRVLAYKEEKLVLSKEEGGAWGERHVLQYAGLIHDALESYRTETGIERDLRLFADYCRYMKNRIGF